MTHPNMNTPTPDYGELWTIQEGHLSTSLLDGKGAYFADIHELVNEDSSVAWAKAERIVACVNACTGMTDPAKEIAAMREALSGRTVFCERCNDSATLRDQLHRICQEGFGNQDTIGGEAADDYVLRRLKAMREAIREAAIALDYVSNSEECRIFCADSMDIDSGAAPMCAEALAKLQPFITP